MRRIAKAKRRIETASRKTNVGFVRGDRRITTASKREVRKTFFLYEPFYDQTVTPWNKKYSVYVKDKKGNKKLIHFGAIGYQQYKDKLGRYSAYDHLDKKRRDRYRVRHSKDNINDKNYPGYWSYHYLW